MNADLEKTQSSVLSPQSFLLAFILLAYLLVAGLFAIFTPPWQAPDEPAHYNYVAQVANVGCCPVIEVGDWDSAYLDQLKSQHFSPELLDDLDAIQYEDHQPPLYYLLASLVFKLTDGSLTALRLFSVVLGTGVVLSVYSIGRVMYPDRPWISLGAAAFVAFLPQHVAMMAAVNNDALAETLIGLTLLATIRYLVGAKGLSPLPTPILLGVLVGVGLFTKLSTLFLAGIVPLAIVLKWWAESRSTGTRPVISLVRDISLFFIPALLLGGIWWARNISIYGWPDFLGLRAHDLVVSDQLRTADYIASIGWSQYLNNAVSTTFRSLWGQFGWMALPMPDWIYTLIVALMLAVISGLALGAFVLRRKSRFTPPPNPLPELKEGEQTVTTLAVGRRNAWIILTVTAALALLAYLYYNTEFVQFQGRYLFPGLIPFVLWMALGLDAWRRLLFRRAQWFAAVIFLPLAALDVYLLWRVIVPGLI
jgi:4-amino-4-deoxy-L-arabinose transferase-like glycosyltransferase